MISEDFPVESSEVDCPDETADRLGRLLNDVCSLEIIDAPPEECTERSSLTSRCDFKTSRRTERKTLLGQRVSRHERAMQYLRPPGPRNLPKWNHRCTVLAYVFCDNQAMFVCSSQFPDMFDTVGYHRGLSHSTLSLYKHHS